MNSESRIYDTEKSAWRLEKKDGSLWLFQNYARGFCSLRNEWGKENKETALPSFAVDSSVEWEQVEGKLSEWQSQILNSLQGLPSNEKFKTLDFSIGSISYGGFSFEIEPQAIVMGLGDKPDLPDLRGRTYENWGTDTYAFGRGSDPLYKNIPFFIVKGKNRSWGFFLDHTARSGFDFRSSTLAFGIQKGASAKGEDHYDPTFNLYIFCNENPLEILKQYVCLTGLPKLPPLWALGYHQSKWSYYPERKVKKVAKRFRVEKIPCDAIYLDIDYMDGFRCFTWDASRFPKPAKLINWLESKGFKTVVMIDPGIKIDKKYKIWKQGKALDVYCKGKDGKPFKGNVWPGPCNFPDFTSSAVRSWWADLYEELTGRFGVAGIWNDMNEPALYDPVKKVQTQRTFPLDTRHDFEGRGASHALVHNIYGMLMSKATLMGLQKYRPDNRPFVLTRSSFSGGQRYAAVWTGDNVASWEHLKIACWQIQSLSISGFGFCGSDIGGFIGDGEGELMVRWTQLAVFHPFFRTHSSKGFADREPWSYGEPFTKAVGLAIELRYHLLMYLYTALHRHTKKGDPVVVPLPLYFPEEVFPLYEFQEFMFGDSLLVAPILNPRTYGRKVYFPKGDWYDLFTGHQHTGGEEVYVRAPLDTLPVFVRAGSFVPWRPLVQSTAEPILVPHTLLFFPGEGEGEVYRDKGEGYAYSEEEDFLFEKYTACKKPDGFLLTVKREGKWKSQFDFFYFEIRGTGQKWELRGDGIESVKTNHGLWKIPETLGQWNIVLSPSSEELGKL